jgi:hypothetical protein
MEMAYRERWKAEIAAMRRVLADFAMQEECKWGKPTYTVDGKNIVIMQGFKEYFSLENWLHRAEYAYAFVNLRPLRRSASDSLLRGMSIRLRGSLSEILPHWPAVMDGVVFIDTARPATRWIAQPSTGPLVPGLHD